jgi:hypothetical protein
VLRRLDIGSGGRPALTYLRHVLYLPSVSQTKDIPPPVRTGRTDSVDKDNPGWAKRVNFLQNGL